MSEQQNRSEQEDRSADLTAFESALAALKPHVNRFDREQFFFLAGQAAALRDKATGRSHIARWGWPAAFSAMTAIAASLLVLLCLHPEPKSAVVGATASIDGKSQDSADSIANTKAIATSSTHPSTGDAEDAELSDADSIAEQRFWTPHGRKQSTEVAMGWAGGSAPKATSDVGGKPLPYFELLEQLSKQSDGGSRPLHPFRFN